MTPIEARVYLNHLARRLAAEGADAVRLLAIIAEHPDRELLESVLPRLGGIGNKVFTAEDLIDSFSTSGQPKKQSAFHRADPACRRSFTR